MKRTNFNTPGDSQFELEQNEVRATWLSRIHSFFSPSICPRASTMLLACNEQNTRVTPCMGVYALRQDRDSGYVPLDHDLNNVVAESNRVVPDPSVETVASIESG